MPTYALDGRFEPRAYPGISRYAENLGIALDSLLRETADSESLILLRRPTQDPRGLPSWNTTDPPRALTEQWRVPNGLRRLGADLFHSPYVVTPWCVPCPLVVTVHDAIGARPERLLPSWRARLAYRTALWLSVRRARRILTLSEASKRDLVNLCRVPPERIVVTPLAAAPEFRPAAPPAVRDLRHRLDLPRPYALYVGSNKPHKNLPRLIEAWARLGADREGWTLLLAGYEDPRYPQARTVAHRLGVADVRFLDGLDERDLPALYTGAEFLAMPSLCEGFGLPLVEAMACGTAVTCSRTSSLPEVAGGAAVDFDPYDVDSIATALATLIREPSARDAHAHLALDRAQTFTWRRTAELTLGVYRDVLQNS